MTRPQRLFQYGTAVFLSFVACAYAADSSDLRQDAHSTESVRNRMQEMFNRMDSGFPGTDPVRTGRYQQLKQGLRDNLDSTSSAGAPRFDSSLRVQRTEAPATHAPVMPRPEKFPAFSGPGSFGFADHYVARVEASNSAYTRIARDAAVIDAAARVADETLGAAAGFYGPTAVAYAAFKVVTSPDELARSEVFLDESLGRLADAAELGNVLQGLNCLRSIFNIREAVDQFRENLHRPMVNIRPFEQRFADPFTDMRIAGQTTSVYQSSGLMGYDPGVDRISQRIVSNYSVNEQFTRGHLPSQPMRYDSFQNPASAPAMDPYRASQTSPQFDIRMPLSEPGPTGQPPSPTFQQVPLSSPAAPPPSFSMPRF